MSKNSRSKSNRNRRKKSRSKVRSSSKRNYDLKQQVPEKTKAEQLVEQQELQNESVPEQTKDIQQESVPEQTEADSLVMSGADETNEETPSEQLNNGLEKTEAKTGEPAEASDSEPAETSDSEPAESSDSEPAETSDSEPAESSDNEPAETSVSEPVFDVAVSVPPAVEMASKDEISNELDSYTDKKRKERESRAEQERLEKIRAQEKLARAEKKAERPHTGLKVIGALILLMIYCSAVIYGIFWVDDNIIDPDVYPKGTKINGVDVSGMDIEQAEDALTNDWNTHTIEIVNITGDHIGELGDFDFRYDIDDELEHALSPGAEKALLRIFQKEKEDIPVIMRPKESTKNFDRQFRSLSIVKEAQGDKPSKNAYIDKSDTEFRIVKEVIGNSVDTKLLKEAVLDAVSSGKETFEYSRSDYHKLPEIVSTSEALLREREYCIRNLSFTIRLRNPVNDYTIPPSWLDKMMKVSEKGKVSLNDEEITRFVSEVVYPEFSSVGDTRKLRSAGGGTYTVTGGTYGYTVDVEREHEELASELREQEDVERSPYYTGKTPGKNWKNDIGNDYIEVSIDKQNVWVVRDNEVVVDSPVVTGVLPRHATPKGVFYIVYKATNTTLKGRNDDGSKYESHVAYWMPFWLGFGLHDASWRGYFGGSIYINNGSHGCVNCPPSVMPEIFRNTYVGMPVIVH